MSQPQNERLRRASMTTAGAVMAALLVAFTTSACSDDSADPSPGEGGAGGSGGGNGAGGSAAGGQSTGAPEGIESVSGSRLSPIYLRGGGVEREIGVYDGELEVECEFIRSEDGTTRCLPRFGEAIVYADENCEEPMLPVFEGDCGEASKNYGTVYLPPDDCGVRRARIVRAEGSPTSPATVYTENDGECAARATEDGEQYVAAPIADPSDFVGTEQVVAARTDELGAAFVETEDGGWFFEGPAQLGSNERCTVVAQTKDGIPVSHHCLVNPVFRYNGAPYGFTDDSCSVPAARTQDLCTEPEAIVGIDIVEGCLDRTVFELGQEITSVYNVVGETCDQADPVSGRLFASGNAATDLVDVDFTVGESKGRLALEEYTQEGVAVDRGSSFRNSDDDSPCTEVRLEGGQLACVPMPSITLVSELDPKSGTFIDAACTKRVLFGGNAPACGKVKDFKAIVDQSDDLCLGAPAVYAAGITHVGNVIYTGNAESCVMQVNEQESYWIELGPKLDPATDLVELTRVIGD